MIIQDMAELIQENVERISVNCYSSHMCILPVYLSASCISSSVIQSFTKACSYAVRDIKGPRAGADSVSPDTLFHWQKQSDLDTEWK